MGQCSKDFHVTDGLGFFPPCMFGKLNCGAQTGSVKKQKNKW